GARDAARRRRARGAGPRSQQTRARAAELRAVVRSPGAATRRSSGDIARVIQYRFYASRRRYAARAWVLALCMFALACGKKAPSAPPPGGSGEDTDIKNMCASSTTVEVEQEEQPDVECGTGERILLCYGDWAAHCDAKGKLVSVENCREDKLGCATH